MGLTHIVFVVLTASTTLIAVCGFLVMFRNHGAQRSAVPCSERSNRIGMEASLKIAELAPSRLTRSRGEEAHRRLHPSFHRGPVEMIRAVRSRCRYLFSTADLETSRITATRQRHI